MRHAALLQFINAKGVGDATLRRLAQFTAHEGRTIEDVVALPAGEIAAAIEISEGVAGNVIAAKDSALTLAEELDSRQMEILWLNDESYPERLKAVLNGDAPPVLFAHGNFDLFKQPAVGFCGARNASERGIEVTNKAACALAHENVLVVSGYANGVDMASHRGALLAGGTTLLVLAEGILRFQIKKELADALQENKYLVVSQFPPKLPWIARNAMRRNATIIGLSDAMILVESGRNGGTFEAGTEALKRHHPLFVIDFADPGPSAEANPEFIKRGGIPIRGDSQRKPNLEKVLEVTRNPRWREAFAGHRLF